MSRVSRIAWTQATWNPVTGCTRVSPGCGRCYIERTPPLRMARRRFDHPGPGATTGVLLHPDRLGLPLRWRIPRQVFVCSLADLFHPAVSDEYLARVWAVMALAPRHTFQVLTKRHARLRSWLSGPGPEAVAAVLARRHPATHQLVWPLPNVWVGVSAETQAWADLRIPALLAAPAAVRWVSAEPLLGPLDLTRLPSPHRPGVVGTPGMVIDAVGVRYGVPGLWQAPAGHGLDWVVVGGESGPGARAMRPEWAEQLVGDCRAAGVPVFVKQLGTATGGPTHQDLALFPPDLQVRQYPTPRTTTPGTTATRTTASGVAGC